MQVESFYTLEEAARAYDMACDSMGRLNRNAALLMHKYHARGATDVTGFGILGHAKSVIARSILQST